MLRTNLHSIFRRVKYEIPTLVALAAIYSLVLRLVAPEEFYSWASTLLATILSVAVAFLVGVGLYSYQINAADDKKRKELRSLVRSELAETVTSSSQPISAVEDDALREAERTGKVSLVYMQPLILEEAAKSGLFNARRHVRHAASGEDDAHVQSSGFSS